MIRANPNNQADICSRVPRAAPDGPRRIDAWRPVRRTGRRRWSAPGSRARAPASWPPRTACGPRAGGPGGREPPYRAGTVILPVPAPAVTSAGTFAAGSGVYG
ncbi:hypothetical protein GCM10027168_48980 [Streptomyces capparidis]